MNLLRLQCSEQNNFCLITISHSKGHRESWLSSYWCVTPANWHDYLMLKRAEKAGRTLEEGYTLPWTGKPKIKQKWITGNKHNKWHNFSIVHSIISAFFPKDRKPVVGEKKNLLQLCPNLVTLVVVFVQLRQSIHVLEHMCEALCCFCKRNTHFSHRLFVQMISYNLLIFLASYY